MRQYFGSSSLPSEQSLNRPNVFFRKLSRSFAASTCRRHTSMFDRNMFDRCPVECSVRVQRRNRQLELPINSIFIVNCFSPQYCGSSSLPSAQSLYGVSIGQSTNEREPVLLPIAVAQPMLWNAQSSTSRIDALHTANN